MDEDVVRGRPRSPQADAAILDAAVELFTAGGLAATTFDGVAKLAGVSRGSLYRRWHSRDELLVAALHHARERAESEAGFWEQQPLPELISLFEQLTVQALTNRRTLDLLRQVMALPEGSPIARTYWASIVEPRRVAFSARITAAREAGELPSGPDPDLLQDQLAGTLLYRALVHPDGLTAATARRYVHDLLNSLGLVTIRESRPKTGRRSGPPADRPRVRLTATSSRR